MSVLGVIGGSARAEVDGRGAVRVGDVLVDWWVGADDHWHIPAEAVGVRQRRLGPAPVFETALRVPSGDAIHRVYAAAGPGEPIVIEVENASPAPFALALVVRAPSGKVALDGSVLGIDGGPTIALTHEPRIWAAGESTREIVTSGGAGGEAERAWPAPVEVALLVPVAHRTVTRAVIATEAVAPHGVADRDAVARGWLRQLERGLRTELPDPLQERIDAARADLLLAGFDATVAVALEDWGFDGEFETAWGHLGVLARRKAGRRTTRTDAWADVQAASDGAAVLAAVHGVLVRETADHVDILPGFPDEWRGVNLAVHDIPLRVGGTLSYAVRWHGARPALLWDAPAGIELRTPVLDPAWSAPGGAGETLLA
ncbi:MAG: hypothetical protein SGJ13_06565 [Actinomycetota bacterium]|nr:hypothetical protein [Actinomycetota bacterium]